MKLLKILLTEPLKEPVAVNAIKNIPAIQTRVVSLLITINPIMSAIKSTYIQWRAVSSTTIKRPPSFHLRMGMGDSPGDVIQDMRDLSSGEQSR
jgi:hypothetical protein